MANKVGATYDLQWCTAIERYEWYGTM